MVMYEEELKSALFLAIEFGDTEIVEKLSKYVDTNVREPKLGRTPLHWAVKHNNCKMARALLKNGADVNAVSNDNLTALFIAVGNSSKTMVKLLIKYKGDVNPTTKFCGKTLLYMAVEYNCLYIVEMLLRAGASIKNAVTPNTTVFDVADRIGSPEMSKLLFKFHQLRVICTAIEECVPKEQMDQIKLLMSKQTTTEEDALYLKLLKKNAISSVRTAMKNKGFLK